jgi:hypothetical protein
LSRFYCCETASTAPVNPVDDGRTDVSHPIIGMGVRTAAVTCVDPNRPWQNPRMGPEHQSLWQRRPAVVVTLIAALAVFVLLVLLLLYRVSSDLS